MPSGQLLRYTHAHLLQTVRSLAAIAQVVLVADLNMCPSTILFRANMSQPCSDTSPRSTSCRGRSLPPWKCSSSASDLFGVHVHGHRPLVGLCLCLTHDRTCRRNRAATSERKMRQCCCHMLSHCDVGRVAANVSLLQALTVFAVVVRSSMSKRSTLSTQSLTAGKTHLDDVSTTVPMLML